MGKHSKRADVAGSMRQRPAGAAREPRNPPRVLAAPMGSRGILARYENWLKATRFSSDLARYNPLHYGVVRRSIEDFTRSDIEDRRKLTEAHCLAVLRQARQTVYGRRHPLAFQDWPILQKQLIRDRPEDLVRRTLIRVPAATGGTTGTPLKLTRSLRAVAAEQAFIDSLLADGQSFRTAKVAALRAFAVKDRADDQPPFGAFTQGGRCLLLSSYHLSEKTVWWYRSELERFRPDILFAYPSMLARLLSTLGPQSEALKVPVILCSSEVMPEGLRGEAESMLSGQLIDYYGLAERVSLAWSKDGKNFYFSPAYGRTELLASPTDPLMPGLVTARIVATGYWNDAMPLVRYDTGDLAILPAGLSAHDIEEIELGFRPFLGILGRQDETILLPDGTVVYGLNQIPKGIDHAWQIQIVQTAPLRVVLFVVPKPSYAARDSDALLRNAEARFPPSVDLSVELVDQLKQTPAGKTPFVIRIDDSALPTETRPRQ
jgi:phenylacetate-CoA ligase